MSRSEDRLDVVIPARAEGDRISACLRALLADDAGLRLRVIVVINGEEAETTEAAVEAFVAPFAAAGHDLLITHSGVGKARALNAGDALRRDGLVMYLDADAVVLPGLLGQVREVFADETAPTLACPRPRVVEGRSLANRAFVRVWSDLPIIREGVIGGGCYAVNAAGRGLWTTFPEIAGDDAFVCALFPPERRIALSPAAVRLIFPERWQDLVVLRARWRRSTREGATAALAVRAAREGGAPRPHPAHPGASRWSTLLSPRLFGSVPLYLAIDLAARAVNRWWPGRSATADWRPLR